MPPKLPEGRDRFFYAVGLPGLIFSLIGLICGTIVLLSVWLRH